MSKAGERLIAGAKEALAIARGEQAAAEIFINGHHYVPREAIAAERERCLKIADSFPDVLNHPAGPAYGAGFAAAVQQLRIAIRKGEA